MHWLCSTCLESARKKGGGGGRRKQRSETLRRVQYSVCVVVVCAMMKVMPLSRLGRWKLFTFVCRDRIGGKHCKLSVCDVGWWIRRGLRDCACPLCKAYIVAFSLPNSVAEATERPSAHTHNPCSLSLSQTHTIKGKRIKGR